MESVCWEKFCFVNFVVLWTLQSTGENIDFGLQNIVKPEKIQIKRFSHS